MTRWIVLAALAVTAIAAGCTMKSQNAPPLTGPSELGTSITVTVSPDILTQDGSSQSLVTITAHDSNGKPLKNLSLRAEIEVGGVRTDFG
ncbi:MAG: Ig-like domain-containing protein, partial [Acidobacteriota bacterium]|nr:Ig-like domain-containing protein [Acidobacteriota bacterium]